MEINCIAKFVVNYCYKLNKPISNLKLQFLLYFIWIENKSLFGEIPISTLYGYKFINAYFEFCAYAGLPIEREFDIKLQAEDEKLVTKVVDKYVDKSIYELHKIEFEREVDR